MINETNFMNTVRLYLSERGFTVFRANVGKLRLKDGRFFDTGLPKGFSDLFAVKGGKVYFLEIKVKPNKPTDEQNKFIKRMNENGCYAKVIYTLDDLEDMENFYEIKTDKN